MRSIVINVPKFHTLSRLRRQLFGPDRLYFGGELRNLNDDACRILGSGASRTVANADTRAKKQWRRKLFGA